MNRPSEASCDVHGDRKLSCSADANYRRFQPPTVGHATVSASEWHPRKPIRCNSFRKNPSPTSPPATGGSTRAAFSMLLSSRHRLQQKLQSRGTCNCPIRKLSTSRDRSHTVECNASGAQLSDPPPHQ